MISLRQMTEEDIEGVLEIERQCFETPWSLNAFKMELKNDIALYIVARYEDKVVGYGGLWNIIDEGHITNIAVLEEFRDKGIGSKILSKLIEVSKSKNTCSMTLEVRRNNESAKHLYKKYGFEEAGVRPKYYADNDEDAIIMWLTF